MVSSFSGAPHLGMVGLLGPVGGSTTAPLVHVGGTPCGAVHGKPASESPDFRTTGGLGGHSPRPLQN